MSKTALLREINQSIELLYIHGMLTRNEEQRARGRFEKMVERANNVHPELNFDPSVPPGEEDETDG